MKSITEALCNGGRIELRGFGSLKVKDYDVYPGRNLKTSEVIDVKSKGLQERINSGEQN